ncbi:hypothetical protein BMT54_11585 [Pasteurellaceae bacterium 15-036681]|nr:hypothetical protein BMT54_11585 [Pasteurellaceae bacterium 15-036681]
MFSLNFANMAISSAIALVPHSFSEQVYDDIQSSLKPKVVAIPKDLKEALVVSDTLIGAFYKMASQDHSIVDIAEKTDLAILFQQSKNLLTKLNARITLETDKKLLASFEQTLTNTEQLIKAIEYKKEADRVLLSRANSTITATFTHDSAEEDLRKFIFG